MIQSSGNKRDQPCVSTEEKDLQCVGVCVSEGETACFLHLNLMLLHRCRFFSFSFIAFTTINYTSLIKAVVTLSF